MDKNKRVLKWNVKVDDAWHKIGSGTVVGVFCQENHENVQVWTEELMGPELSYRHARVFGTGHPVPMDKKHVGMVHTFPLGLVWHVYIDSITYLAEELPRGNS